MIRDWIEITRTCNTSRFKDPKNADFISRWLMNIRVCVFSMTLLSALIGIVLATGDLHGHPFPWGITALVLLGLLLAHAANNLVNDYYDVLNKVDTDGYVRTEYAPHPLLSGLTTVKRLWIAVILFDLLDLAIAIYLTWMQGWPIMAFAATGLALSVFYVAPPLKLKYHGLGEVAIFLIWGPLIIGGTFFALTGHIDQATLWATMPYGMAVTAVVLGKHLDKRDQDIQRGVHTLPVILGERYGRYAMITAIGVFYASVLVLCATGILKWPALLVLISLPKAWQVARVLRMQRPSTPVDAHKIAAPFIPKSLQEVFNPDGKEHFPLWPLWFVVWGVWWVRSAGMWLVLGMIAGLFL